MKEPQKSYIPKKGDKDIHFDTITLFRDIAECNDISNKIRSDYIKHLVKETDKELMGD